MTILITAASGHLGHLIIGSLIARGTAPADIVAGARTPDKVADLADLGVRVVPFDYDRPDTLVAGFQSVERVVLVSSSEFGKRAVQHQNVIDAAKNAGVNAIAYTSVYQATTNPLPLSPEHAATEQALAVSEIPHVLLRNGWYIENYAPDVERARQSGVIAAAVGDARVAAAARADYAEAAAIAITDDAYLGRTLELVGDDAFSYEELASAVGALLGSDVSYQPLTSEQLIHSLRAAGLDEGTAGFVAGLDAGIADGALDSADRTLSGILGRPTTPLLEGLRAIR
ncbi:MULTISPECIES: NmrA family NAD(P)-binding protein [unclassified Microbacterium]|uniref:NAD(P)H-binding protein n=1 Tax=unclassified Microbacterium TaxID=2609290 RepID=UPI000EAA18FC|nr:MULTISPECIES: NmrA family NAD(P)-binding protein [unclassified Microbacterium]MBT2486597.1 NmrA family NAD(P)-binding protein [Microbacterium sp. ISL-108]RKN69281.1 NAD(P)-dependent oxidoreductase [Microbacterium sp. CGR2]